MLDRFNRNINYLRISVTDRCNLRCRYCMPEEGITLLRHDDILTFDEITAFTREAVSMGITKVRITGGEPLVRKNVTLLVAMLADIDGITDLSMTTNGTRLAEYAGDLAKAGLMRVNVSLDTLDPEKFRYVTRGGDINEVLQGIKAAKEVELNPVKINCVIKSTPDEDDARMVAEYSMKNGLEVRFIRQMDLANGSFSVVHGGSGGNCAKCNRLRLTPEGTVKPCLFSDMGFSVRELGSHESIIRALGNKPQAGTSNKSNGFYNIGG
ncbi:MAG TPA: radical SAM protein [Bacteroidales bacterium]|nr:radical SAM protein [Bacteroidales bacterium]